MKLLAELASNVVQGDEIALKSLIVLRLAVRPTTIDDLLHFL